MEVYVPSEVIRKGRGVFDDIKFQVRVSSTQLLLDLLARRDTLNDALLVREQQNADDASRGARTDRVDLLT